MDPAFATATTNFYKPASQPRDFISIRSLSYQKSVSSSKLQEDCMNLPDFPTKTLIFSQFTARRTRTSTQSPACRSTFTGSAKGNPRFP